MNGWELLGGLALDAGIFAAWLRRRQHNRVLREGNSLADRLRWYTLR